MMAPIMVTLHHMQAKATWDAVCGWRRLAGESRKDGNVGNRVAVSAEV